MKIVRNDVKETKFGDVAVGSVFIAEDAVFMKTFESYEIEKNGYDEEVRYSHNAIDLSGGNFARFSDLDMVRVCNNAHLVVD